MKYTLTPFPGTSCAAVKSLQVNAERPEPRLLRLTYTLNADMAGLRIPAPAPGVPTLDLWKHTCFEMFYCLLGEDEYHEFNFAPSGAWDHYQFGDYRMRLPNAPKTKPVMRIAKQTADTLEMVVDVPLETREPVDANLAAVIESTDGTLTYWALDHQDDEPNFHNQACFKAEL
ncbi:MAG: DOMON-like domain-containing protein [Bdellovibrionales bacterium]